MLDANVLFPAPLRDLLVRLAIAGLIRAKWTEQILDETFRSILRVKPELSADRLYRTRTLMNRAVRDVMVSGFEARLEELALPDPDDRHVLAAAIECGADHIVTWNLKDFPSHTLEEHGLSARTPDDLLCELFERNEDGLRAVLRRQRDGLKNPPMSQDELLGMLERNGIVETVSRLRGRDSSSSGP